MTITTDFEKLEENKVPIMVVSGIIIAVVIFYFVYVK
jgi:hypothetical protein